METVEAYSARKKEELDLLNSLLADPLTIRSPKLITEVIEQKFHLAAALKAEHVLHDWALTETAWTHSHRPRSARLNSNMIINAPIWKFEVPHSTGSRNSQAAKLFIQAREWPLFRRC
jgi:hypothetical protein